MNLNLKNKQVVVIGGTYGIGYSISKGFIEEGSNVHIVARNSNKKVINELKDKYKSNMLTCLHKNSIEKQKFPALNMIRQICKCNNIKVYPVVISKGYDKASGKKIIERYICRGEPTVE